MHRTSPDTSEPCTASEALPLPLGCACHTSRNGLWGSRRSFVQLALAGSALAAAPWAQAQVAVGKSSVLRNLVPAETLEQSAQEQYAQLISQARAKGVLVSSDHPQVQRLHRIAQRLIPHTAAWNDRARQWRWSVALIRSDDVNAFCMPGGKIAFFTGILERLQLTDDEAAMIMGHEMAHALREHAREQLAKSSATGIGLSLGAQLLGLGDLGNVAARLGTQLLSLRFSRSDESDADLVGLEIAARAGYQPHAAVSLWQKMGRITGSSSGGALTFLSTHPSGPDRIRELERNVPRVEGLYRSADRPPR